MPPCNVHLLWLEDIQLVLVVVYLNNVIQRQKSKVTFCMRLKMQSIHRSTCTSYHVTNPGGYQSTSSFLTQGTDLSHFAPASVGSDGIRQTYHCGGKSSSVYL